MSDPLPCPVCGENMLDGKHEVMNLRTRQDPERIFPTLMLCPNLTAEQWELRQTQKRSDA